MNKRGQFYLIAAVIIIGVLISVFLVKNYARTTKEERIYDLGKELKLETGYVYDFGTYNPNSDIAVLINNWADKYQNYSQGQAVEDWIFVYSNGTRVEAITFISESQGTVRIGTSNVNILKSVKTITPITRQGNNIAIQFGNFTHNFEFNEGENFFFLIKSGGETARS